MKDMTQKDEDTNTVKDTHRYTFILVIHIPKYIYTHLNVTF